MTYLKFFTFRSLVRSCEMVISQLIVGHDVVIHQAVSLWAEVPWLLLRVVCSTLEASKLVLEVKHIISRLIPESIILVLGQLVMEVGQLICPCNRLDLGIFVGLCDGVVTGFTLLVALLRDFDIRIGFALELLLMLCVCVDLLLPPLVVTINGEEYFIGSCLSHLLLLA